jgi:hypothetical protein
MESVQVSMVSLPQWQQKWQYFYCNIMAVPAIGIAAAIAMPTTAARIVATATRDYISARPVYMSAASDAIVVIDVEHDDAAVVGRV